MIAPLSRARLALRSLRELGFKEDLEQGDEGEGNTSSEGGSCDCKRGGWGLHTELHRCLGTVEHAGSHG